jgi:hypothetical protein
MIGKGHQEFGNTSDNSTCGGLSYVLQAVTMTVMKPNPVD